jgi:uncharacterized membrane protein
VTDRPQSHTWRTGYTLVDIAVAALFVVGVLVPRSRHWLPHSVHGQQESVYVAMSAVAATLLGFMVAALTILLTIGGRRLTVTFMQSTLYGKTLGLFHVTAIYLAATMLVAIAGFFVDRAPDESDPRIQDHNLWLWTVTAFGVVAAWRFVFSLSVLRDVADLVVTEHRPPPSEKPTIEDRPPDTELLSGV